VTGEDTSGKPLKTFPSWFPKVSTCSATLGQRADALRAWPAQGSLAGRVDCGASIVRRLGGPVYAASGRCGEENEEDPCGWWSGRV
jgi:hypothetical protein